MNALVLVDIQNDFLPGGALGVPRGDEVVPVANQLIQRFSLVVATQDWHPPDHVSFAANHPGRAPFDTIDVDGSQQTLWPVHCVQDTHGSEFHQDLSDDPRATIVSKGMNESADGYSGFDGTNLGQLLKEEDISEVWVGGLATDYCVKHTVLDALREGFEVKALADAMRAVNVNPADGVKAIEEMREAGAEIVGDARKAAGQ